MKYDAKSGEITFANVDELAWFANEAAVMDFDGVVPETDKDIEYGRDGAARASKLDVERVLGLKPYTTLEEMDQEMRDAGFRETSPHSWSRD